jgi:Transposase domain (DUF772)
VLRWLWRWAISTMFLRGVALLRSNLLPTHTAMAAGLGFLGVAHVSMAIYALRLAEGHHLRPAVLATAAQGNAGAGASARSGGCARAEGTALNHLNLAHRWFCRLGLDGAVPNHSTFSKSRHGRFRDSDLLRRLFEATVRRCMAEGIVGGQGFVADASMIRTNANRQKGVASHEELTPEDASRAVTEYLVVLDDAAFGAVTEVLPKLVSSTDPAARWTAAAGGPACYAYCDNYHGSEATAPAVL